MGTLTFANTTTQVRPWPSSAAWNNYSFDSINRPTEGTTYGATLTSGAVATLMRAVGSWKSAGSAGISDRLAQKIAHAIGMEISEAGALSTAQTGSAVSTNVVDRGYAATGGATSVVIVTTVGATPTCTYQIESSLDGSSWTPLSTADSGTPTSFSTSTFTITSATTTTRLVDPSATWRYIRVTYSANTNVTNTTTVQVG